MTILGCVLAFVLGVGLGLACWLVSSIKEATTTTTKTTKTTVTTKATTNNNEYYCHGDIVFDPDGNPVGF